MKESADSRGPVSVKAEGTVTGHSEGRVRKTVKRKVANFSSRKIKMLSDLTAVFALNSPDTYCR